MTVYFAHISDTHIGPTRDYARHGFASYPCAERLIERLNTLPTRPDFVIHTGDIVADPDPAAWELARALFDRLELPIYYVNGNHDRAADILQYMPMPPHVRLGDDPARLDYAFERAGERFVVIDASGPPQIDPHGMLTAQQLAWLRAELTPAGPPLTVFIHFPLLPINAPWMDANMLVLEGEALHALLRPARDRVRGVFHGHVHQPMQLTRDGITYTCAPSTFAQFAAWPADEVVRLDADAPPGFAFVHLLADGRTIVHQHSFARPD